MISSSIEVKIDQKSFKEYNEVQLEQHIHETLLMVVLE